jgi:co-chaperonin GroES (HSP10)
MKGIRDYIAHIPKRYNDKLKTESGFELYSDSRWSAKEMANTIVDVVETPFFGETPIKIGYQIFIDSTVVFNQTYEKTGSADSPFLVDKIKGYYKVSKDLIIAYRENESSDWIAFEDNSLLLRIEDVVKKQPTISGLIIPEVAQEKYIKGIAKVFLPSAHLIDSNASKGDNVYFAELTAVDVYLDGKKITWVKDRHVIGVQLKNDVA